MTERRKGGRRKSNEQNQKLTKQEDCYARYVRFNCPTKTTMFEGNEVHYFTGSKAIDVLYESKKYGFKAKDVKFGTRQAAIAFMRTLLEKGLFFRARKLVPKKKEDKKDKEKSNDEVSKSPKKKLSKSEQRAEKEDEKHEKGKAGVSDDNDEDDDKDKKSKEKDEEEKKKRKVKLELHQDQSFNDSNDVYVWIFDPTPFYKKVIGALMVIGTIAGCLFPLWPVWLRQGIYYLSIVGLACFGLLIGVAMARTLLFAIIWAVTMGKHKLWLLPNLTEDCGFFESFQPWYTYEYCPGRIGSSNKKKKKAVKKNDSGEEENVDKDIKSEKSDTRMDAGDIESKKIPSKTKPQKSGTVDDININAENDGSDEINGGSDSNGTSDELMTITNDSNGNGREGTDNATTSYTRQRRRARKADDDFVLIEH